jgi:hypothetical protein
METNVIVNETNPIVAEIEALGQDVERRSLLGCRYVGTLGAIRLFVSDCLEPDMFLRIGDDGRLLDAGRV